MTSNIVYGGWKGAEQIFIISNMVAFLRQIKINYFQKKPKKITATSNV